MIALIVSYIVIGLTLGGGLFIDAIPEFTGEEELKGLKMTAVLAIAILLWPFFLTYVYQYPSLTPLRGTDTVNLLNRETTKKESKSANTNC